MKHRFAAVAALAFVAACGEAPTDPTANLDVAAAFNHVPGTADAPSLSEDFNSGVWNPALEDHDNKFVVFDGMIFPGGFTYEDDRHYVRTVASGYNDSDFTAELLIRVGPPETITFFGLGAGEREGVFNEPQGAFFRVHSGGLVGNRVDVAVTGGTWVLGFTNLPSSMGDYPARITKSGSQLTFEIAGASATVPMPASLNDTNSRIYFGTSSFYTRFDNLNIVASPYAKNPVTKDDCKNGGWAQYGFRNQGLCIQFVNTGKDSR